METTAYRSPYVFFSDGIGDCFFSLPALRALAELFDGRLTLICAHGLGGLFFSDLPFKSRIEIPGTVLPANRAEAMEICKNEIKDCDLFIYLNPYYFEEITALVRLLNPVKAFGCFEVFPDQVKQDLHRHAIESAFNFARVFDEQLNLSDYVYPPGKFTDGAISDRIIASIPADSKLIIVHPDTTKDYKTWPYENYSRLFDLILDDFPEAIIMIVGTLLLDYESCKHKDRVFSAADLPLEINLDLIPAADYFIGIDSCFLHAADFYRVPALGIFANTSLSARYGLFITPHYHAVPQSGLLSDLVPEAVYDSFKALKALSDQVVVKPEL